MVLWLVTTVAHLGKLQPPLQALLFENWAELRQHGINVVVCSENPEVLDAIIPFGLMGMNLLGEKAAYYKTYFESMQHFPADMVGFFNGDNVFDGAGLASTVLAIRRELLSQPAPPHVLLVGQRKNAVDSTCMMAGEALQPGLAAAAHDGSARINYINTACKLGHFMTQAQDYFILDRAWLGTLLPRLPLARLGGVIFDNWLTEVPMHVPNTVSVDGTQAILNLHLPHGSDIMASHGSQASAHNRQVHATPPHDQYWCGQTTVCLYEALFVDATSVTPRVHVAMRNFDTDAQDFRRRCHAQTKG